MIKTAIATFALVLSLTSFLVAAPAFAESEPLNITKEAPPLPQKEGVTPSFVANIQECVASGNCSLCDVLKFFGTIAQWILATVGGLALFFFVLGGFDLLTSGGKQEAVEKGKKKITGALIGLLIVLGAYFIINAVLGLAIGTPETPAGKKAYSWQNISCK